MQTKPATTPGKQSIVVRIEDVDMQNRLVHAFDKSGSRIQVSFRDIPGGGLLRIPNQSERWTAERHGWIWRLTGRISSTAEQSELSTLLQPGDSLLDTPNILYVNAEEVILNGRAIGTTVHDQYLSASPYTSVTLSSVPADMGTVMPFLNGLLVEPTLWDLFGQDLIFRTPLGSSGTLVVYYEAIVKAYDDDGVVVGRAIISGAESYTP